MHKYSNLTQRITFILLFSTSWHAYSTPLQDGFDAFRAGQYAKAIKYWLPLAQSNEPTQDNADAMYNIGLMYMNGLGVKKDYKLTKQWFKRAAFFGSADAAYNLGILYTGREFGFPSKKDALYWWTEAAKQGHADSQFNLGVFLVYGRAGRADPKSGLSWWYKAATQGHKQAAQALTEAYSKGMFGLKKDLKLAAFWRKRSK